MNKPILRVENLNAYFGTFHAVKNVNIEIFENQVTSIFNNPKHEKTKKYISGSFS